MKQIFELMCPHCGHSHHASSVPFNLAFGGDDAFKPMPQPMICESCEKGVTVNVDINSEAKEVNYTLLPSLTPYYAAWLFWNPEITNINWYRASKIAIFPNPELFEDAETHPDVLADARESLRSAMEHAVPYIDEGRTIAIGSTNTPEELAAVEGILTSSYLVPTAWAPSIQDAANIIHGISDITTAFCNQGARQSLTSVESGELYWMHNPATARVVDYLLRNPWFVTQLEATINRFFKHTTWRPIIAESLSGNGTYFNSEFSSDVEPVWVQLYPENYRKLTFAETKEVINAEVSIEWHLSVAERFSPDRPVMYSDTEIHSHRHADPVDSRLENFVGDQPSTKKKPTLH